MPILGSLASGAIGTVGLAQQAMLAFLKASTAISGSSFVLQQTVSGPAEAILGGTNNSIYGQSSFAADGDYLVTGAGWTNEVLVWNLSDGSLHMTIPAPSPPPQTNGYGWQIDIHGDYFITGNGGTGGGYTTIHNVSTGALITTITGAGRNVAINENYAVGCALGGFDKGSGAGKIKIFELATSTLTTLSDPNYDSTAYFGGGVQQMDISGNNLILAPNNGSLITVHDIPTALSNGNLNTTSLTINPTVTFFTSLTAEGNYLALGWTSDVDKRIFVYDLTTGTLLHTLAAPIGAVATFGETVDIKGNYLVAGNRAWEGGPAAVYDLTTGTLLQTFTETDATDISTWLNPSIGALFGSAVAITDSKTIIGSNSGGESANSWLGAFLIYSNPGQAAPAAGPAAGPADWSNATLAYTLDNPNPYGTSQDDYFANVAISSTYAIIGAQNEMLNESEAYSGIAYIFDPSDGSLVYTLQNPNPDMQSLGDLFGVATAISDTHAIVGAYGENDANGDNSGIAYIFDLSDGSLAHTINNPNAYGTVMENGYSNDQFGNSVAISGNYAIVGASYEDDANGVPVYSGNQSGKAYIFKVSDGSLLHTLDNPDAYGDGVQDYFGTAVAISGDYAIVSARLEDDAGGNNSGKAYIFNVTSGSLVYTLDNPNGYGTSEADFFGQSVAMSDTHAIVGAYGEDDAGGTSSGKAYIFDLSDGSLAYTLHNPNQHGTSQNDHFGWSVSISDTHAIVSAFIEEDADGNSSGKVYIYDLSDGSLTNTLDNPNAYGTSEGDSFGSTVSISGSNIIVGAYAEDDAGGTSSGKSYIFSASAPAEESTGWTIDLSNVTYNTEFSLNNQMASYAFGQTLSTDGTKLYVVGQTQNIYAEWITQVFQYSLSTAFDINTASYDNVTFNPSSQDTNPMGIAFNTDGTKMYLVGTNSDLVLQYSLSTPWDVSTASYDNVSISAPGALGLYFKDDGTKMYTIGFVANFTGVRSFSLSTGFDLSTATDDLSTYSSIAVTGGNPFSVALNPDGTKMYILGAGYNESIYRYSLSTAFDVSTATYDNESISLSNELHLMYYMEISRDGTKIYVVGTSPGTGPTNGSSRSVLQFDTGVSASEEESTGWTIDLSNVTYDNVSFGIGNIDGTPYQITFNADGTKMYQLGANTKRVIQYTLSTAFDLSTASTLSGTFDINASGQETSPSALFFSTDGTKMYICGFANATVYQYSLSVAFDISTAIYANQAYDISIQESYPTGIVFNPDGTKMYVCGFGDNIHEYGLTTAFDVSSASFNNVSFSVTNQATQGWGFRFNADGTKMYVVSSRADTVYQYSLATAFDLSSTSYDNVSISVNSQDNDPLDIAFNTDGTKMYVSGSQTDTIYQYSTGL